jgi:hypothetical protein
MNGNEKDWWECTTEDDEWEWFDGSEEQAKPSLRIKTYAVQYKTDEGMKSVELDGISERDAIKQLTEELGTEMGEGLFKIISIIEVDYDE